MSDQKLMKDEDMQMDHLHKHIFSTREEWLLARKNFIGGSDASAVLGLNPYKTNIELWEEKTGRRDPEDISCKSYVQYGNMAEPLLRELFALDYPKYLVEYEEGNLFTSDITPWAHASLDGWLTDQDGRKGILEIKTTNIMQSMQKEKWDHRIPDNYYLQVLHYLMVTGFEFAILKAQLKYEFPGEVFLQTRHYFIEREEIEEDIRILREAEKEFWEENVLADRRPALVLHEI